MDERQAIEKEEAQEQAKEKKKQAAIWKRKLLKQKEFEQACEAWEQAKKILDTDGQKAAVKFVKDYHKEHPAKKNGILSSIYLVKVIEDKFPKGFIKDIDEEIINWLKRDWEGKPHPDSVYTYKTNPELPTFDELCCRAQQKADSIKIGIIKEYRIEEGDNAIRSEYTVYGPFNNPAKKLSDMGAKANSGCSCKDMEHDSHDSDWEFDVIGNEIGPFILYPEGWDHDEPDSSVEKGLSIRVFTISELNPPDKL